MNAIAEAFAHPTALIGRGGTLADISLTELARLSKELNQASDALADQINQVEQALNELKLGVRAYVRIRSYDVHHDAASFPTMTETIYLGYSKVKGKWCLSYLESNDAFPEDASEIPLRDAPRLERMDAVDKLPELLHALEKATSELANQARSKAAQVGAFAFALRGK